ncbi:MAG: DUF2723 domain-containing protein [Planctomycetes bacterium]|nr:DUF2723 domain-containing protein [Planctomycetota bacterium]
MSSTARNLSLQYATVLVCAGAVYSLSCAPGLLWQDSGVIQYRVLNHDVKGVFGLALAHPLFYDLAFWVRALPVGGLPWRVNMIAAIAGAVALANLFLFMKLWLGSALPAVVAVLSLGLAHTFWQHASMAETYTLWCAFFTAELLLLLCYTRTGRRCYLYGLALTNGLALSVHLLAVISGLCYGVYLMVLAGKRSIAARDLAVLSLLWGLGAAPYGWLVAQAWLSSGDGWGTLSSALFGDRWQDDVLNVTLSMKIVKENILFLLLNFPTPNLLLCGVGAVGLIRLTRDKAVRAILLGLAALYLLFASRYTVPDRYAFFIPFYVLVAVLIGMGVQVVQKHTRFARGGPVILALALVPIGVYCGAPAWAAAQQVSLGTRADLPYRDDYRYFLQPWKTGEHGAARFATEVLEQVEPNALIYADMTTVPALLFVQQHRGLRPDVHVVSERMASPGAPHFDAESIAHHLAARPVYVVSRAEGYCPRFVLEGYRLQKRGLLWQVQEIST